MFKFWCWLFGHVYEIGPPEPSANSFTLYCRHCAGVKYRRLSSHLPSPDRIDRAAGFGKVFTDAGHVTVR